MNKQPTVLSRNRQSITLNQLLNRLLITQQILPTIILLILLIFTSIIANIISLQHTQAQICQSVALRVDDNLQSARFALHNLSKSLSFLSEDKITEYISEYFDSQAYFETVLILDPSGHVIFAIPDNPVFLGLDQSSQSYYKLEANPGDFFFSEQENKPDSETITVFLTTILQDGRSIVAKLSDTKIQTIITDSLSSYPSSHIIVVDQADHMLFQSINNLPQQQKNANDQAGLITASNLDQLPLQWIDGNLSIGASNRLNQISWRILTYTSLLGALQSFLQISLLIIIAVILFSIFFIRSIKSSFIIKVINPLAQLNQRIKTITRREGVFPDLLTEVDRPAFEEIGELARNFTTMSRAIMVRQSALSDSEQKYRMLIEHSNDAIFLIVDGTFELVNHQFCCWFHLSQTDILQKPLLNIQKFVSPSSKDQLYPMLTQLCSSENENKTFEIEMIHNSECPFFVEAAATSFSYRGLNATQFVLRDITKRKITEKAEHEQRIFAEALVDSASALNSTINFDELMDRILSNLYKVVPYDASTILLIDKEGKKAEVVASRGYEQRSPDGWITNFSLPVASTPNLRQMVQTGLPMAIPDPQHDPNWIIYPEASWIKSYIGAPIRVKESTIGFLSLDSETEGFYTPDLANRLLAFADQVGLALNNARMLRDLQRSNIELTNAYITTLQGWSKALELRDSETEGHTQRVLDLTLNFSKLLGISTEDLTQLRYGVLLHDIGKIGIPDSILFKTSSLNDEEWGKMKLHPVYAYQILSPIDYLKKAVEIPYCHHERWDGSGYPRGLKGREIPLSARIFSIVDVWDGLRSERVYHSSWTEEEVVNYLRDQSGKMFDPELVEFFINGIMSGELP